MRLQIELLGDLCAGSGSSAGNRIDTDVTHDRFGFPLIPAKRIKGCLREAAEDLADLLGEDEVNRAWIVELFGSAARPGALRLEDGVLPWAGELGPELERKSLKPDQVLSCYTYTRTQTAINEDGAADDGSLRTIRVIRRGLCFTAPFQLDACLGKLKDCCALLRHIGLGRTRGLGEVSITVKEEASASPDSPAAAGADAEWEPPCFLMDQKARLDYLIHIDQPVMLPGNRVNVSQNVLPASSILGCCAKAYEIAQTERAVSFNAATDEKFTELFVSGQTVFTDACISTARGTAFRPIPLSIARVKGEDDKYINRVGDYDTGTRIKSARDAFVHLGTNDTGEIIKPVRHISYHVSKNTPTPELFQYFSMEQGQYFRGSVFGGMEALKCLYEILHAGAVLRLGKSKNAQYGRVTVIRAKRMTANAIEPEKTYTQFALTLQSPAAFLNRNGMYATDRELVLQSLERNLKLKQGLLELQASYMDSTVAAGYNLQWRMPRAQIPCFARGCVFVFRVKKEGGISLPKHLVLGERRAEGFGLATVTGCDVSSAVTLKAPQLTAPKDNRSLTQEAQNEWKSISGRIALNSLRNALLLRAHIVPENAALNTTTIGRLRRMLEESDSFLSFDSLAAGIQDEKKRDNVKTVLFGDGKVDAKTFAANLLKKYEADTLAPQQQDRLLRDYLREYLIALEREAKRRSSPKTAEEGMSCAKA